MESHCPVPEPGLTLLPRRKGSGGFKAIRGEAAMTVSTTSRVDSELAGINDSELARMSNAAIANGNNADPMSMIEQLPEVSVPISLLVPGFHLRQEGTDPAHVRLLADAAGSVQLPSILVQKSGSRIIDGLHRLEVAKLRGEWTISARIVDCTDSEALVLAIKSNTLHGLPLSRADRISGAKRMLAAHPDWSDRAVAGITGLSAKSIASLRNSASYYYAVLRQAAGARRETPPGHAGRGQAAGRRIHQGPPGSLTPADRQGNPRVAGHRARGQGEDPPRSRAWVRGAARARRGQPVRPGRPS